MSTTELLKDWAPGRDTETFVRQGTKNRIDRKQTKSGYSSELVCKVATRKEALKKAYQLCSNRIKTMTRSGAYQLAFHDTKSQTNGKRILVSTEAIDNKKISPAEGLSVLIGLATHETCHVLYTDFNMKAKSSFIHSILNILEDERIEMKACERWPGYSYFLADTKKYYFDFLYKPGHFPDETKEIFDCFFKLVRYPKHLDHSLVAKHAEFLAKIKSILTPYPQTFKQTYDAAHAIAELF